MNTILLPIASLFIALLLMIIYYGKRNVDNKETKLYSKMLIINLVYSILAIVTFVYAKLVGDTSIISILQKFYMISMLSLIVCMILYNIAISKLEYKFKKSLGLALIVHCAFFSVLILATDLQVINYGDVIDGYGLSYDLTMTATILYLVAIIISTSIIFIKEKEKKMKGIPFLILIIFYVIGLLVREHFPHIMFENFFFSFMLLVMYFTIENPDIKLIEELEIARDEANKANQAKTEFLSSMSHEIRTPLNAIVGFSQTLYEEKIVDSAKEQVQDIITASNNLLELVNGILDISKIEANKLEIINDEYSFKRVFEELVSLSHARLGDKNLIFKTSYDESIPKVLYGDRLRVKQIILNILTNSIKYTKKGFIEFTINSVIKDDVCRLIISVEDSGVGIKKENIDKLFTKFQRFEERNTTIEGTGLGLAITKKLVELMNGQIIVQSVYGQGSKFTIAIDQKIISNPTINVEESEVFTLDTETFNLEGRKILVVDDNKLNIKVATKLLSKYNLEIDSLTSGAACLDKINNGITYDLIFLDDMMPKMSGVDTLKELKKNPNYNTPTVILTANAIAGMREKYLNDGFDDYLAKPIEKSELNRILKEFLMKEE